MQELRPLADPLVWGNYNVAYVSSGNRQYGQPAGGRFRGGLGKLIFKTTLLAQSVLKPDLVTNKARRCCLQPCFLSTCPDSARGRPRLCD